MKRPAGSFGRALWFKGDILRAGSATAAYDLVAGLRIGLKAAFQDLTNPLDRDGNLDAKRLMNGASMSRRLQLAPLFVIRIAGHADGH